MTDKSDRITIYAAAALFNARENFFNSRLVGGLEGLGYKVYSPQRDGFEVESLKEILSGKVKKGSVDTAAKKIIYCLDVGGFIPKSDIVIANFDEPIDEGVSVESLYARWMGKFVIGLRSDIRSPYGELGGHLMGMHAFPAYQCSLFISYKMQSKTFEDGKEQINSLVHKINQIISDRNTRHSPEVSRYVKQNETIKSVFEGAHILFDGVRDIHSKKSLEKIASRYIKNKEAFEKIGPKKIVIG
jgi:nucleoside 2-deoxyribosyltransferase